MEQPNEINRDQPLISVCMPVYNGENFIIEAIESVLNQSYNNFEIIISDDCSKDKTEEICRSFTAKDKRISYIRQEKNIGANENYNYVRQIARGVYFTQLAQDDLLEKDFLKITSKYLDSHPNCIIVTGDFESIDQDGNKIKIENLEKIRDTTTYEERMIELFSYPISKTFLSTYGLIRTNCREVFLNIRYPKKIVKGSEMRQLSRLSLLGDIVSIPFILRRQRHHKTSMYNREFLERNEESFVVRKSKLLFNLWSVRIDQAYVLWMSKLNLEYKIKIFVKIYLMYIKYFFSRLIQRVKKYLRFK